MASEIQELRELSTDELHARLEDLYREDFNFRMQIASEQLAQVHLLKKNKKSIARVKTLIRERELV